MAYFMANRGSHRVEGGDPRYMSQIRVCLMQRFLGPHTFGYVADSANKIEASGIHCTARGVNVLDLAVGHQQAMLAVDILAFSHRSIQLPTSRLTVVGVHALYRAFRRGLNASVIFEDVVVLLGPIKLPARNTPAKRAGVAYLLA